ncbi:SpoIIE family protein phosphatase [Occallatibacter riparius]|uniref:SpoIIE family protein phosphatase n=1 Tax=Occallatibacter riparius TaxID=1002689 RepID=A0A9J7BPX0_9BACT|nr:SpoIIE family protein phosphatase [Occallatibacter riparius]UWZ84827.1 SpoIIE family protein phosphatase [Occallatibacter riparius]
MLSVELDFLQSQLEERKRRLETAIALAPDNANAEALLREVDSALDRFAAGTYGVCETCHESVERDRLLADPLICYCLDHLTDSERAALQRDLDLASALQRGLLPPAELRVDGWETSYHYAPLGPVSGDYCDLYPWGGSLFFMLGDVSGKGVAASMRMAQMHALFRSLIGMGLPLAQIVTEINRFLCNSALAGEYATLVCGRANPEGDIELFNAGHLPVVALQRGQVQLLESTSFPVGMFCDTAFAPAHVRLSGDDMLFLFTDGVSEAVGADGEYGVERVARLIGAMSPDCAAGAISACLEDLRRFAGRNPGMDDVTLLAMRRTA